MAANQGRNLGRQGRHRGSGDAAHGLHCLHVVVVRVGDQHHLDVGGREAELHDVWEYDRPHLVGAGVDQDVADRGGHQDRGDIVGADIVYVAHDLERLLRLAVEIEGREIERGEERCDHVVSLAAAIRPRPEYILGGGEILRV